jgi:transposase
MLTSTAPAVLPAAPALSPARPAPGRPDPEVPASPARARRRQFTVAYKLRILQEADHCAVGQLGALLRREGLYSSHLTNWRRQRADGALGALAPRRRGRPATSSTERELARLREENARLARKLAAAETVIDVQKKVALLLGLPPLDPPDAPDAPGGPDGRRP